LIGSVTSTIACSLGHIGASALIDRTWTVTYSTGVHRSVTGVVTIVIAYTVAIGVEYAIAITNSGGIERPDTIVFCIANTIAIGIGSAIAIAISLRYARTSTVVNRTWPIAYPTYVGLTYTGIAIVADTISVEVLRTSTATYIESVELVSVTVAISCRDIFTATFVNGSRPTANATCI
jgi:hypothetical protein